MLNVYFTIDTEYSAGLYQGNSGRERLANFQQSISCIAKNRESGIFYQMDQLNAADQKAVFYVDPMPALVWGNRAIEDIVLPIVEAGHDVHLHPEWLQFARSNPLGDKTGRNMADFDLEEQKLLVKTGIDLLMQAGAPKPVAFRAGNYGANDDTLRALAFYGIAYDSSFCPGIPGSECEITLQDEYIAPTEFLGITELPVGALEGKDGQRRHAQLTALSFRELRQALIKAEKQGQKYFTIVSHSFELMSRDRRRINHIVRRRFEKFAAWLAVSPDMASATFQNILPVAEDTIHAFPPIEPLLKVERQVEQLASNLLYGSE